MSIEIGPYTAGEIPPPLVVTFKDSAGNALDFSAAGWVGRWVTRLHRDGASGEFTASDPAAATENAVVSGAATGVTKGQVTYTWVAADFATPGEYEGEMWVGNGTNRYASERFTWTTRSAIAIPNI